MNNEEKEELVELMGMKMLGYLNQKGKKRLVQLEKIQSETKEAKTYGDPVVEIL